MGRVTQRMRAQLETQGFLGLSDDEIRDIYYWLRFAPLVACLWTSAGVLTESSAALWAFVPLSLGGAVLSRHPLDTFYMLVIRPRFGTAAIPAYGAPRRFTCALSAMCLAVTGVCFAAGATTAGRVLGAIVLAVMAVQVTTGACVPATMYAVLRRAMRLS